MDLRTITKTVAHAAIMVGAGHFVTKTLVANAPSTSKYHTAEIAGLAAGAVAADQLKPVVNDIIDEFFDSRDSKKITN